MATIKIDDVTIDTADTDAATTAYAAASAGTKTKIRNAVTAAMMDAVRAADLATATAWSAVSDALAAAKPAVAPTDYNRVIADRIIALRYAAHRLIMGDDVPDGIDADAVDNDIISAMVAEWTDGGDMDDVSDAIAEAGRRMATQKITRATERGDIESHIVTAFADMPVGTVLTVAQIRTRSNAKSDGAIAARVWPRPRTDKKTGTTTHVASTLDFHALGVEPTVNADGVRALKKVADASAE